jgi:hypothetical protein
MSSYKNNPVTDNELQEWFNNKLVNPRTKRRIKKLSNTYNYLHKKYIKMSKRNDDGNNSWQVNLSKFQGPAKGNHLESFDNKDPISQEDIWVMDDESKMKKASDEIPSFKLFSYLDSEEKIRCFNIESFMTLIDNNCTKHPITGLEIELDTINNAKKMFEILKENNIIKDVADTRSEEKKISDYAFSVFQKFSLISIFVDHEWFLKLSEKELDKLYYESSDFYNQNVDSNNKKIMVPPDGNAFPLTCNEFNQLILNQKKMELLKNIDKVISSSEDEGMKTLGKYLMLGGLGVVCKEIREKYPDFVYGFNINN